MAHLLSNVYTKNYWNRTTIVEIIVGGWVVSFFETQCRLLRIFGQRRFSVVTVQYKLTCVN